MNKQMLGVIEASTYHNTLTPLTAYRSVGAVPFAGRYRLIDFILSNMVNSGISSVAIFPRSHYRSLMDHLGSGKEWDLDRKRDGLYIFPPIMSELQTEPSTLFSQLRYHIDYFLRSTQKYVLISNTFNISNIDFKPVLRRHVQVGAAVTSLEHEGEKLGMYVLEKSRLVSLLQDTEHDFKDVHEMIEYIQKHETIHVYEHTGYVARISDIPSYFSASMSLLKPDTWSRLFLKERSILTKVKDEPPTRYVKGSNVKNSIVANGCVIEGHVENSIIFRGVRVEKGAVIKNSIVMQKGTVHKNSHIEYAILDKDVKVEANTVIKGDTTNPHVVAKGTRQGALMNS